MTFLICVLSIIFSNSLRNLSKTTIVSNLESVKTLSISLYLYKGLMLTTVNPHLRAPKKHTGKVCRFGSIIPILLPFVKCK